MENQRFTIEDLLYKVESAESTANTLEVMSIASEVSKEQMCLAQDFDSVLSEIKEQQNLDSLADQFGKLTISNNLSDEELMKELDKLTAEAEQPSAKEKSDAEKLDQHLKDWENQLVSPPSNQIEVKP